MRIHCLYGPPAEENEKPCLLTAWDDVDVESNPSGWQQAQKDAARDYSTTVEACRVVEVAILDRDILDLFEPKTVTGVVTKSS